MSNFSHQHIHYADENTKLKFTNNRLYIERICDTFLPRFIVSDKPINTIDVTVQNNYMSDEMVLLTFPLEFCNKLCNHNTPGYTYMLPWKLLQLKPLLLVSAQYYKTFFLIDSEETCEAYLYGTQKYLDTTARHNMVTTNHELTFKQFYDTPISLESGNNTFNLEIRGPINGIFLDNIDLESITEMTMFVDEHERFIYDYYMLQYMTIKISDDCYYLNINDEPFYSSNYAGCLKINNNEIISIKITSVINQNINIRTITKNVIRVGQGFITINCPDSSIEFRPITWTHRELDLNKNTCIISQDIIKPMTFYMSCDTCNCNYIYTFLKLWLERRNICPMCNTEWTSTTMYRVPPESSAPPLPDIDISLFEPSTSPNEPGLI